MEVFPSAHTVVCISCKRLDWHLGPVQLQSPGLAANADPGSGIEGDGSEKRPRWLGICRHKVQETCQGFTVALLDPGFFSGESCWGPLQSRSLVTTVAPTAWLIQVAFALLSFSDTSPFTDGRWGETGRCPSCSSPKG